MFGCGIFIFLLALVFGWVKALLALFFFVIPLKIDIYLFFLMASPFLVFSMMIHLYVQNWVHIL